MVLKVLDPLRGADPVGRARFERALSAVDRIRHDGVERCLGLERDGPLEILVLEYIEGETLEALIAKGPLPADTAQDIALRLAEALAACHAAGVLHRDLKPANVIVSRDRGPVIVDFGMAWFSAAQNLTRTGALVGSPRYLAPEMWSSSLHDARVDIYALGAILFEMLAGEPLRSASSVAELALSDFAVEFPSVSHRAVSEITAYCVGSTC